MPDARTRKAATERPWTEKTNARPLLGRRGPLQGRDHDEVAARKAVEGLRPRGGQGVAPDHNTSVGAISGAVPDILRGKSDAGGTPPGVS
jgi:hypothetical protein